MKKLIVANWKMYPTRKEDARKIFIGTQKSVTKLRNVQTVVCPPFVYLPELAKLQKGSRVQLGVQDLFYENEGAFTGQVSPAMAKNYKAKWAILGHSERRERGEDNELVARKAWAALKEGYTVIVCIGERARSEEGEYYTYVRDELEALFAGLKRKDLDRVVIAYEPIWAIGKRADEALAPNDLFEMVLYVRKLLIERFGRKSSSGVRILYGGSVKPENAAAFVEEGNVDGLLVGSASLNPKKFLEIAAAAQ